MGNADGNDSESVFAMDPQAVIWDLSRSLVTGQRTLAEFHRSVARATEAMPENPMLSEFSEKFHEFKTQWYEQTLPMLAASMQLAIEVFDTFGPGMCRVSDPTEAAIWNNKHFVWFTELGGRRTGA